MFVALGWFLLSAVLIGLGAFFLCRESFPVGGNWVVGMAQLPVCLVIVITVLMGQNEIAIGVIWGTVAINTGVIGLVYLLKNMGLVRENWVQVVWTLVGLCAMLVATRYGDVGCFAGCGLVLLGLVAFVTRKKRQASSIDKKEKLERRTWLKLLFGFLIFIVGVVVLMWQSNAVIAFCGMPDGRWAMIVLAPLLFVGLIGKRKATVNCHCQWTQSLLWTNVLLVTIGCGVMAILGRLQFSQVIKVVVMPWVALMLLILGVILWMPKKTTRWWGGLLVLMYVGLLTSLIW